MTRLQLHGTPLSHFTRKIRILLAELGVDFEWVRPPGVLVAGTAAYGDNPLMRVPALVDGHTHVFDSDHIARYVIAHHDVGDRFGVTSLRADDLNRLAAINGVMANEVVIILAQRTGVEIDTQYFRKLVTAMESGLAWLDERTVADASTFDYRDIALVSLWQHLVHYAVIPLDRYGKLAARSQHLALRPSVAATTPEASLAEAKAAGWVPG